MRYFAPVLSHAPPVGPDRFGGVPLGLPAERWPRCAECGSPMSFLSSFAHAPPRLDLRREGRVLYAFMCHARPGDCSTWEAESGANAVLILEPEEQTGRESPMPEPAPEVVTAASILRWDQDDDGIDPALYPRFFDDDAMLDMVDVELDHAAFVRIEGTRFGSVPAWLQSAGEGPRDGWRYVGQFEHALRFPGEPPPGVVPWSADAGGHLLAGPLYGSQGRAFLFVRDDGAAGCFLWQS